MPRPDADRLVALARRRLTAALAGDLDGVGLAEDGLAEALAVRDGADPAGRARDVEVVALLRLADLSLAERREEVRAQLGGTSARRRAGRAYAAAGRVAG